MQKTNNALQSLKPVFIILVVFALLLLPATAFAEDADTYSTSSDPDASECFSDSDTDSTETEPLTEPDENDEDEDMDEAGLNDSDNESSEPETDSGSNTTDETDLSDENDSNESSSDLDPTADETSDDSPSDSTPQENPEPSTEPSSDEDPSELDTETTSADSDEAENDTAAAGEEEDESVAADDDGSETGNSYVAEITPDAVVDHEEEDNYEDGEGNEIPNADESANFTVTFTEVGDSELGSARVDIPDEFTSIVFNADWSPDGIETNSGQQWKGKLDGQLVYLRAVDEASILLKDDSVSVTFTATTPGDTGVYEFETRAWTEINNDDADFDTAGNNQMATGYTDPVVIVGKPVETASDLAGINDDGDSRSEHYVQVANIDLNVDPYNDGDGWEPIDQFYGSYHGNGYSIENLFINRDSDSNIGLFGATGSTSMITNVTLVDVNVTGDFNVGGLVGYNDYGTIANSSSTGSVSGNEKVGGLVGYNEGGTITGSHATGEVLGGSTVGGLIGRNYDSTVENCSAEGNVTGASNVGGLIGHISKTTIAKSHATGEVTGTANYTGGLVGYTFGVNTITESYATGKVDGGSFVGGLVGESGSGNITNSYATGDVSGSGNLVGGLAGTNNGTITDSHSLGKVTGNDNVGGLVGRNRGDITESYATGDVKGDNNVGGLVGLNNGGTITGSYAKGDVTGTGVEFVGGLVGVNDGGTITGSYAKGDVTGTGVEFVGGLVGDNNGDIAESYATGNVIGDYYVGGLVGFNFGGSTIDNSYARGDVDGINYVGGLVGMNNFGSINNSYSTGQVSGTGDSVGGLVGSSPIVKVALSESSNSSEGQISNSFYNSETSGQSDTGKGEPKTTAQLQTLSTFESAEWSITGVDGSYPQLWWEVGDDDEYTWHMTTTPVEDPDPDSGPSVSLSFLPDAGLGSLEFMTFLSLPSLPLDLPELVIPRLAVKALVYPLVDGTAPIVTADFVSEGTALDLAKAISLYLELLRDFEENAESMSEAEYAVTAIELAVAWAGIQALEARLSSEGEAGFDLSAVVEAYENALQQLSVYGDFLSEEQLTAVLSVLVAVAEAIEALGAN